MRAVKLLLAIFAIATIATAANAQGIDWQKVDVALGRSAVVGGDVHRYGFPRTDLQVTVDGVTIRPTLALGGWAAFKPMGNMAMVMGDLVLLGSEINPVISKLIEGGLEVTAIHNHLLRAEPATFYMHIGGHGDPVKMATALHAALGASKTPLTGPTAGTPPPLTSTPRSSIRSSAPKVQTTAASMGSPCRGATRSPRAACRLLR